MLQRICFISFFIIGLLMSGCAPFYPASYQRPAPPADSGQVALEILKQLPVMMAVKGVMDTSMRSTPAIPQFVNVVEEVNDDVGECLKKDGKTKGAFDYEL